MVTGGKQSGSSDTTDTTEVFDSNLGSWAVSEAKLPHPMRGLRATNIDDRVLIFGKYILLTKNSNTQKRDNFRGPR